MPPTWLNQPRRSAPVLDRDTVHLLADSSARPAVARVATAWLQAYEASLAGGVDEEAARAAADAAWDRARLPLVGAR